jgi:uncharacterized protein YbjT (DUF2867 family)
MSGRVLVIGATGSVGSEVVSQLVRAGQQVKAATRTPASVHLSDAAVECVEFDFERPETFAKALTGVDRVFLIARPGDDDADVVAFPLIDEMKRLKVRRVVNLTAMGVEAREDMALRKIERYLEESELDFTHLRPNFFMQVFSTGPLLSDICSTGGIHLPAADARLSYIDVRDIAAVAARALIDESHIGKAYTLTGGRSLDHYEIAQYISGAAERSIEYIPISEENAKLALANAGLSRARAERVIGFYRLVRQGFCAPVSADAEVILGRPPISFPQFANDFASSWR